ncbi:MAG: hypothetical protein HOO96_02565 [Polyangiaceae bacterium]|nr:hypothetical protein [Polyangiaceae bacterium]
MSNPLRDALVALPRAANVKPGDLVDPNDVFLVQSHRNVVDFDRPLVVANRGMGKSLWAHVLRNREMWKQLGQRLQVRETPDIEARIAFNGGISTEDKVVTPAMLSSAIDAGFDAREIFHGVLLRHLASRTSYELPTTFDELLVWQRNNTESAANVRTDADRGPPLLLLFDGLDRLGRTWAETQSLVKGVLQVALEAQSLRNVRFKLFLRNDQFEDLRVFEFPDSSKLRNTRVELRWSPQDVYGLLFFLIRRHSTDAAAVLGNADHETRVQLLAGKFMGADHRRGHVFTWVPTHLADARGEISPRTFLTAWKRAGEDATGREPAKVPRTPVDPKAIHAGVQAASEDRMNELSEDYPWVAEALRPLGGSAVPILRTELDELWRAAGTLAAVRKRAEEADRPVWVTFATIPSDETDQLIGALEFIGVVERRDSPKGPKINIPDIFRVNAGIKRRGGVVPRRSS